MNQKKIKIVVLATVIIIVSIFTIKKINEYINLRNLIFMKESIISMYKKSYPDDNFYFMSGPDYNKNYGSTNIRYKGIISSDRLEKMGYFQGIEIGLESYDGGVNVSDYEDTLDYLDVYLPLRQEAKNVFGENLIFEIDGTYTEGLRDIIINNLGTSLPMQEKTGFRAIIFTMFVDDLSKDVEEKQEEWKEKLLEVGKKYWTYYNVTSSLQLSIFDRKLLYSHDLARASIGGIRNTDERLKGYLERIRAGERLNMEEEAYVLARMRSGYPFIRLSNKYNKYKDLRSFDLGTDGMRKEEELKVDNVTFNNNEWSWGKK